MKKINKRLITTSLLILSVFGFYQVNSLNYIKHIEIKKSLIEHPENLPTKEAAINSSFWFKNLRADIYWLETIQYIWGNAIGSEYKKYLYVILDLITELNPYFEHPYSIGQLLLPSYNQRYEDRSDTEKEMHIKQWIEIWEKWMSNFCDADILKEIDSEDDLEKLWSEERYQNPCHSYIIPYYLAYIHYFYNNDPRTAAYYYKISSTCEDAPDGAKVMTAIMQWKWGNREKSYFMFLSIAKSLWKDDYALCGEFAKQLDSTGRNIFYRWMPVTWELIKQIENIRFEVFWEFNDEDGLGDTKCSNYVNKATRELNLYYIELANDKYKNDAKKIKNININEF